MGSCIFLTSKLGEKVAAGWIPSHCDRIAECVLDNGDMWMFVPHYNEYKSTMALWSKQLSIRNFLSTKNYQGTFERFICRCGGIFVNLIQSWQQAFRFCMGFFEGISLKNNIALYILQWSYFGLSKMFIWCSVNWQNSISHSDGPLFENTTCY